MPVVYVFFPEVNQLELEDIDHLFDKDGITGGVWKSKGGRAVEHGGHVGYVSKCGMARTTRKMVRYMSSRRGGHNTNDELSRPLPGLRRISSGFH